jgi:hypothetical protein
MTPALAAGDVSRLRAQRVVGPPRDLPAAKARALSIWRATDFASASVPFCSVDLLA